MSKNRGQVKVDPPSNPRAVGSFVDPRTHARIDVFPKKGENPSNAIARVKRRHGMKG